MPVCHCRAVVFVEIIRVVRLNICRFLERGDTADRRVRGDLLRSYGQALDTKGHRGSLGAFEVA